MRGVLTVQRGASGGFPAVQLRPPELKNHSLAAAAAAVVISPELEQLRPPELKNPF